jgi:uncharacterized protein (TIGR01244 family)
MRSTRWIVAVLCLSGAGLAFAAESPEFPLALDSDGFREILVRSDRVYIAGQPTEQGLARAGKMGVTTVVNLRTPREMDDRETVPFDEEAAVAALGMKYVHIPLGGDDHPYDESALERFAEVMKQSGDERILLHCTVAWRASHLWAAWLVRHRGLSLQEAVRHAEAINFGTLPIEKFLGTDLELRYAATE